MYKIYKMNRLFLNPLEVKSVEFFGGNDSYIRVIYKDDSTVKHDLSEPEAKKVIQDLHTKMDLYIKSNKN